MFTHRILLHSFRTILIHTPTITTGTCLFSSYSKMASPWTSGPVQVSSPAFTQRVVEGMRTLFPEKLADKAWDNVGLLLDNTKLPEEEEKEDGIVMVTNDLTYMAAEEAVKRGASIIVSYHPIIFRGLKSITTTDPQQSTLLLLARHNIAVYSPHTALDASISGINTWLIESALGPTVKPLIKPLKPIISLPADITYGGYGATATVETAVPVREILKRFAAKIGGAKYLNVAVPERCNLATAVVKSVAVCAGSGGEVLRGSPAELWITGEMSHHEALAAVQKGRIVVTTFHSNTEREFLRQRLRPVLEGWLRENGGGKVFFSESDRDPYAIVDLTAL